MPKPLKKTYSFASTALFKAVQMNGIFLDSKTFCDLIPLESEQKCEEKFLENHLNDGFDLKQFVEENFTNNSVKTSDYQSDKSIKIDNHLNQLWPILTRKPTLAIGSLIDLPFAYVVPGGRFQEIYYWDSYFTILGLQVCKKIDLIENIIDNFSDLINRFGFIPNGNRTYFLGRSQPPFFSLMVAVLKEEKGDSILSKYLPVLEKEYQFWMEGKQHLSADNQAVRRTVLLDEDVILNRYWDEYDTPRPESYIEDIELVTSINSSENGIYRHIRAAAESGWDFSSRWFKDGQNMNTIHTTDILPVDLNCLLWHLEMMIYQAYLLQKDDSQANLYINLANQRKKAIETYFYDEAKNFYFDYDFIIKSQTESYHLGAMFPLFFHLSNPNQAKEISKILEEQFLKNGGVITTLNHTGQQWDAPNGWAPLQYISYKGLKNYDLSSLAKILKNRWMQTNEKVYAETGKMTEKYNVEDTDITASGGEYPNQDGFGWTNGVYLKLLRG